MENFENENKFIRNIDEEDTTLPQISFEDTFTPPEKRDMKPIIIKIVAIVAAVCLVLSSSVLVYHFADQNKQRNIIKTAQENFDFDNDEKNDSNEFVNFDELKKQNPDIVAWITIPGTNVNHPVYKTTDNDFYLNHNMLKQKGRYGALFFDYRDVIEPENQSQNLTIYGHNMKFGSMFHDLQEYDSKEYSNTC